MLVMFDMLVLVHWTCCCVELSLPGCWGTGLHCQLQMQQRQAVCIATSDAQLCEHTVLLR